MACQRPGVDPLHGYGARLLKKALQVSLSAPVAGRLGELFHHEAGDLHPPRLEVFLRHAIVTDQGIRQGQDLASVGGIGQHLLVAGHRRTEHHLAHGRPRRADRPAFERSSIL
jgi:hypothetical protein